MKSIKELLPPTFKYRDETPTNPLNFPNIDFKSADVAEEILRSVEYALEEHHASIGSYSLLVPLRLV
jgi:hypothetical protein